MVEEEGAKNIESATGDSGTILSEHSNTHFTPQNIVSSDHKPKTENQWKNGNGGNLHWT